MDELFKTYTAFCKDENGNLIKIENIHAPNKEESMIYVKKFNKNFRVITLLTDEEIQWVKDVLDGKEKADD